jgi:UDP-N-acetylmuramoylalanine--D-glutamate ligase
MVKGTSNAAYQMPGLYRKKGMLVLGLARSGRAAARLLLDDGAEVTCFDENRSIETSPELEGARVVLGSVTDALLEGVDEVVLSPGIATDHEIVQRALGLSIPVVSELELGYRFSLAGIIAVTGTNGKSTTVNMIGGILRTAGREAIVAGNVGLPFCSVVRSLGPGGIFVLEVSSFQLETVSSFHPDVGGILNLTPDHLDRYESMEAYVRAKARILDNLEGTDSFFYNALDGLCAGLASSFGGRRVPFSSGGYVEDGVYLDGDRMVRGSKGGGEVFMDRRELRVVGLHNVENALAAVAAVEPYDIPAGACRTALGSFEGLAHRMELVGTIEGVDYFNDSKATNVEAAVMSLRGLDRKVVLIAGGKDKGSDFSKLLDVADRMRAIVTLGEAAPLIEEAVGSTIPIARAMTMQEAVEIASRTAGEGEIVLLSPACASFDMFTDFEHRGEVFKSCVKNLRKTAH